MRHFRFPMTWRVQNGISLVSNIYFFQMVSGAYVPIYSFLKYNMKNLENLSAAQIPESIQLLRSKTEEEKRSWSWLSNSPNGMVKKSYYQQKDYTQLYTLAGFRSSRENSQNSSDDKTFLTRRTLIFLFSQES